MVTSRETMVTSIVDVTLNVEYRSSDLRSRSGDSRNQCGRFRLIRLLESTNRKIRVIRVLY